MPHPSDQTSDSRALPPAQLNPLLNPLLAEHMGRWAEVYFTSPPENREQAVLELLHELEAERSRNEGEISAAFLVRCKSCGHENPPSHRFCGMCGALVSAEETSTGSGDEMQEDQRARRDASIWRSPTAAHSSAAEEWSPEPRSYENPANNNELSLFQSYRPSTVDDEDNDWDYDPVPSHPVRGYLAAVLAIVIGALGYMAWRGMQSSQGSRLASPAPPVVATETPSANTPSQPPAAADEPHPATTTANPEDAPPSKPAAPSPAAPSKEPEKKISASKTARSAPVASPKPAEPTNANYVAQPPAAGGKGTDELAIAQRYLSGTNGQRRDTAEASRWLWKSIAKHNSEATLLLADLYLKGDGVSKNCDQARVLLYSAARKGISGAGERLRNLPAFGCQ